VATAAGISTFQHRFHDDRVTDSIAVRRTFVTNTTNCRHLHQQKLPGMNASIRRITVLAAACAAAAWMVGCASSSAKLNHLSLGMSRDEVVKTLGRPDGVSAQGDVEFLTYNLLNKGVGDMKEFVVRIQKGSVESFGERSNFGSSLFGTNAPAGATAK
jgi:hypothetical protein